MEARSIFFQGNWDPRAKKAVDKILGQNFGVNISSRELCQDAILMMSSYRQNCLWPGLIRVNGIMSVSSFCDVLNVYFCAINIKAVSCFLIIFMSF